MGCSIPNAEHHVIHKEAWIIQMKPLRKDNNFVVIYILQQQNQVLLG